MTLGVGTAALLYSEFGGGASAVSTRQAVRPAFAAIAGLAILCVAFGIPAPRAAALVAELSYSDH